MGASGRIIIGSRGSDLALAQARLVEQALRAAWPDLEVTTEIIRTSGDEGAGREVVADRKAGRKGMFTREIEKQLLVRRIDLAVHSAKDLPSEPMGDLEICAALPRGQTGDVLIAKKNLGLMSLPQGATIATGSVRRQHQLRWKRPDLTVVDLRGNVPTRLRKLDDNENWSGIVLARAGLERLGLKARMEDLSKDEFVPAGGQGVIALQIRCNDERLERLTRAISDEPTMLCLRAEREFLRLLEGDCDSPVGVHATRTNEKLRLQAQVFGEGTLAARTGVVTGNFAQPEELATELMEKLYGTR
ncbi:MAG TPA: hydroxymethylbilane synthase [Chthoniobacteraceae bacterium]|nr:hydroxymethylbilane synthase [Chthoniobacteraceae bacterium]